MTQLEIQERRDELYDIINEAQSKLEELRATCQHPNKASGSYSYRIGNIQPAMICVDCGHATVEPFDVGLIQPPTII